MHGLKFQYVFAAAALAAGVILASPRVAEALPVAPVPALGDQITDVQYRDRGMARGARPMRVRPMRPVARPGVRPMRPIVRPGRPGRVIVAPGRRHYYYGNWRRNYRWSPGAAIAAGAAIGFVGAAAAASYYGQPPEPGLCWFYTNPSRTSGFWDACPY